MVTRKLTDEELVTIARFEEEIRAVDLPDRVGYMHHGNFTTCVLLKNRKVISAGASKRKPTDRRNLRRGEFTALRHALEAMG